MYLDPADVYNVPRIILGSHQIGLQKLWPRLVQPGWKILEVGAGQGFHTLSLALLTGPTGRVLAWEPYAAWRAVIHDNVAAHRMERIVSILAEEPMPLTPEPDLIVIPSEAAGTNRRAILAALVNQGMHICRVDGRGELLPRHADECDGEFLATRQPITPC
jgi:protein-L-isoaspartate O-methyltransferase